MIGQFIEATIDLLDRLRRFRAAYHHFEHLFVDTNACLKIFDVRFKRLLFFHNIIMSEPDYRNLVGKNVRVTTKLGEEIDGSVYGYNADIKLLVLGTSSLTFSCR
jgi:hypothetical protein